MTKLSSTVAVAPKCATHASTTGHGCTFTLVPPCLPIPIPLHRAGCSYVEVALERQILEQVLAAGPGGILATGAR